MGLLRRHHEEKKQYLHYRMREKLISIGDDYWIEDDSGNRLYKVDGKAMRVRDTWLLEDTRCQEVAQIREKRARP